MSEEEDTFPYYASDIQTYAEELMNTITHGTALALSIPAVIILILLARMHGNTWHVIASALYGSTLVLMYTCSTVYHWSGISDFSTDQKEFLRNLDHCAVYFLIAGTYTPLTLVNLVHNNLYLKPLRDNRVVNTGWVVLVIVWLFCFMGVTLKIQHGAEGGNIWFSYGLYVLMGWMGVIVSRPFIRTLPRIGLRLLVAGGLAYTFGIIFLLSDALPFNHPVWHLFVSAGSIFHYLCVLACTIPVASSPWLKMETRTSSIILDWCTRFASTNLAG